MQIDGLGDFQDIILRNPMKNSRVLEENTGLTELLLEICQSTVNVKCRRIHWTQSHLTHDTKTC